MNGTITPTGLSEFTYMRNGEEAKGWDVIVATPEDGVKWVTFSPKVQLALVTRLHQEVKVEYDERLDKRGNTQRKLTSLPGIVEKKQWGATIDLAPVVAELQAIRQLLETMLSTGVGVPPSPASVDSNVGAGSRGSPAMDAYVASKPGAAPTPLRTEVEAASSTGPSGVAVLTKGAEPQAVSPSSPPPSPHRAGSAPSNPLGCHPEIWQGICTVTPGKSDMLRRAILNTMKRDLGLEEWPEPGQPGFEELLNLIADMALRSAKGSAAQ